MATNRPFNESDPDAPADLLRQRLANDGYLFLRDLLDRSEVHALGDAMLDALAPLGWVTAPDLRARHPGAPARAEHLPGYDEGCAALQALEPFHRLAFDPGLQSVLGALFDSDALVHPRKIPRVIWPDHRELTTGPHQEWPFFQGTADLLVAWIPVHDIPRQAGGLKLLDGSHRQGLWPMESVGGSRVRLGFDRSSAVWLSTDYRAGDVLLFHCLAVHSAFANMSGRLRLSVDFRYQPAGDAIGTPSLRPQFWPAVPDWPVLTAGWSSTHWVGVPEATTIFEPRRVSSAGMFGGEIPPPPSRLLQPNPVAVTRQRLDGDRRC